jgi:AMP nucleosidase
LPFQTVVTPEAALDRLELLYAGSVATLRQALNLYLETREPPDEMTRARFCYPELRVTWQPSKSAPSNRRAYAKFAAPGIYTTTVTHPREFRAYLLDQLRPLVADYEAVIEVGTSTQEIPYSYVLEGGDELARGEVTAAELARWFPVPLLSLVGDEIADGSYDLIDGEPRPLGLFDAVRVDYSLRRLVHYTGTDWRNVQPWVLLTNYHRYVDQFVRLAVEAIRAGEAQALVTPGGIRIDTDNADDEAVERVLTAGWHKV